MEKFWKAAIGVAGLGAIGSFVFWSLYTNWLSIGIFSQLTAEQTFVLMIIFLLLTFAALIAALVTYLKSQAAPSARTNAVAFSIPGGWTLRQVLETIAGRSVVEFVGFHTHELACVLPRKEIEAPTNLDAMRNVHALTGGRVRPYTVEQVGTGKYIVRVR